MLGQHIPDPRNCRVGLSPNKWSPHIAYKYRLGAEMFPEASQDTPEWSTHDPGWPWDPQWASLGPLLEWFWRPVGPRVPPRPWRTSQGPHSGRILDHCGSSLQHILSGEPT